MYEEYNTLVLALCEKIGIQSFVNVITNVKVFFYYHTPMTH